MEKPLAGLSLDLDNLWAYLKAKNDPSWNKFPSYLDLLLPIFLKKVKKKITVFIVGQDAALPQSQEAIKEIARQGHEIGNHSFHHEPWLSEFDKKQLIEEMIRSESAIAGLTGISPKGFRGPGFSWSPALLDVLHERGYLYDSSLLPSFLGPLARIWFRKHAGKSPQKLFGSVKEGFMPASPFLWSGNNSLLELPVTTIPFFKTPFHMSYLLYLWEFSPSAARAYFKTAINLCKWTKTPPNFLLHPTDFFGSDQVPELSFFPGMKLASAKKQDIVQWVLEQLNKDFMLVPLDVLAKSLQKTSLKKVKP